MSVPSKSSNSSKSSKLPPALLALLISAFAIGTTEFVIMGILPDVAGDLNVSISAAGLLVTAYALGVAVGGPIITGFTGRLPRKRLLFGLMLIFVIGNVIAAVAPNYTVLMLARIFTSLAHGTFFGIGAIVATRLVAPDRQASAIALMFTGLTLSNILGVPFGTMIGQGLGWRATFWIVTLLGAVSLLGIALLVPRLPSESASGFRKELRVVLNRKVGIALLLSALGACAMFTVFTYITPLLTDISGFSAASVTPILLLLGVGTTVGNLVGGKLADWRLLPSLLGTFIVYAVILTLLTWTSHDKTAAVVTIFLFGCASFAITPALQMRVLDKAKESPNIASALNISSFNVGNAAGAFLGGWVIDGGPGLGALPWVAGVVALLGALGTVLSGTMDRGERRRADDAKKKAS